MSENRENRENRETAKPRNHETAKRRKFTRNEIYGTYDSLYM